MHPIFRSWGQEDTNFSIELLKDDSELSLAMRLRQVFEFLVSTILESLFVKRQAEKLEVGGEDTQQKIVSKAESYNKVASENLLAKICDIMFANTNRYLRMRSLFPSDYDLTEGETQRFK